MFEDILMQIYYEYGAKLSEESIVYFHYGIVNALGITLDKVKNKPAPVNIQTIKDVTISFSDDLSKADFNIEKEKPQEWLNPLIISIAKIKEVELYEEAQKYLNQLVYTTSRAILRKAASRATLERPAIMVIFLEDLEAACRGIFSQKPWVIC